MDLPIPDLKLKTSSHKSKALPTELQLLPWAKEKLIDLIACATVQIKMYACKYNSWDQGKRIP